LLKLIRGPSKRPSTALKGDLAQAQAQLGKSTLDVERDTPLAEARAIAKSQLDNEIQAKLRRAGRHRIGQSGCRAGRTQPGVDESHLAGDGIAGIAQIQIGNLVGSNSILTSVSHSSLSRLIFRSANGSTSSYKKNSKTIFGTRAIGFFGNSLELILTDGSGYAKKGKILLADRQVDPTRARSVSLPPFRIPETFCAPVSMTRARRNRHEKGALLTPQSAVAQSQGSYQVRWSAAIAK